LLVGVFVLGPIYRARATVNGAPFHQGDIVQIINGRHRGTVAHVYSGWQGGSVRVDLGAVAKESYQDVFAPTEILRIQPPLKQRSG
jgi:hypothetical protein